MASTPQLKVFNQQGEYVAAFKYCEDAAAFVAILGEGAEIRWGHGKRDTVWVEGREEFSAAESYDGVAAVVEQRRAKRSAEIKAKHEADYAVYKAKYAHNIVS